MGDGVDQRARETAAAEKSAGAQAHWNSFAAEQSASTPEEIASLAFYGNSPSYDSYRARAEEKMIRKILAPIDARWRVLDIGCGPGRWTVPLAKECAHVTAVDFSTEMLEHTRKRCEAAGVAQKVQLRQKRIEELSVEELGGSFDLVLAMGVIQFVPESALRPVIECVGTCVSPGGFLIHRETLSPAAWEKPYLDESGHEVMRSYYKSFDTYRRHFEAAGLQFYARRSIIPPSLAYSLYSRISRRGPKAAPEGALLKLIIALHEHLIDPLWYLTPRLLWWVNSRRITDQAVTLYRKPSR